MNLKYFTLEGVGLTAVANLIIHSFHVKLCANDIKEWGYPFPSNPSDGLYIHSDLSALLKQKGLYPINEWKKPVLIVLKGRDGHHYYLVPKSAIPVDFNINTFPAYPGKKVYESMLLANQYLDGSAKSLIDWWSRNEIVEPKARLRLKLLRRKLLKELAT